MSLTADLDLQTADVAFLSLAGLCPLGSILLACVAESPPGRLLTGLLKSAAVFDLPVDVVSTGFGVSRTLTDSKRSKHRDHAFSSQKQHCC